MNALSTIAAAVTTSLTAAAIPVDGGYAVERHYMPPDYLTYAAPGLKVLVIGQTERVDLFSDEATRATCPHEYGVTVVILKRVAAPDVTKPAALVELDALSDFREAVLDWLTAIAVMGADGATLSAIDSGPANFDAATLNEKKTYLSVIALKYRLHR